MQRPQRNRLSLPVQIKVMRARAAGSEMEICRGYLPSQASLHLRASQRDSCALLQSEPERIFWWIKTKRWCFALLSRSAHPPGYPLCPWSCVWWVQLLSNKAHPPMGSGPNPAENLLKTVTTLCDTSEPKPTFCQGEGHAHRLWSPATSTQERTPGTNNGVTHPVIPTFRITFTEKWALLLWQVTSSSQAPSVHKSLSLKVICPRLGGSPGTGRVGHVVLSFGTLSAAAHLPRTGMSFPLSPWRSHGGTPGAATCREPCWASSDTSTPLTFSHQRG